MDRNYTKIVLFGVPFAWLSANVVVGIGLLWTGATQFLAKVSTLESHIPEDDQKDEDDDLSDISLYFVKKSNLFGHCGIFIERATLKSKRMRQYLYETMIEPSGRVVELFHSVKPEVLSEWHDGAGVMVKVCSFRNFSWKAFVSKMEKQRLNLYALPDSNCRNFSTLVLHDLKSEFTSDAVESWHQWQGAIELIKQTQRSESWFQLLFYPALFVVRAARSKAERPGPKQQLEQVPGSKQGTLFYYRLPVGFTANCPCS